MATIKSYTDVSQSKKLAEILPIESADMWWSRCTIIDFGFGDGALKVSYAVEPCNISQFRNTKEDIPCWSLAALMDMLPIGTESHKQSDGSISYYYVEVYNNKKYFSTERYDNPIDACVAMIENLHELNLL